MHIGSHGYAHYWFNLLSLEAQEKDINLSIEFLNEIDVDPGYYTMCYPHAEYNIDTIDILKRNGFKIGLTIETDVADLDIHHPLELPRLDTNDIPKNSQETPNQWYEQA
jgi:peptidoglycan/xylan/chitin deacetylase (PgdA/CDA1 family)